MLFHSFLHPFAYSLAVPRRYCAVLLAVVVAYTNSQQYFIAHSDEMEWKNFSLASQPLLLNKRIINYSGFFRISALLRLRHTNSHRPGAQLWASGEANAKENWKRIFFLIVGSVCFKQIFHTLKSLLHIVRLFLFALARCSQASVSADKVDEISCLRHDW